MVLAIGVGVAVWGITTTFQPGPVTKLEPVFVDQGPSAPPPKPDSPRTAERSPAAEPVAPAATRPSFIEVAPPPPPPRVQPPSRPAGSVVPVAPIAPPAPASSARRDVRPPPELRFETYEQVVDGEIYGPGDADVTPPEVQYPMQLGRVPIGVLPEDLAYVEVVINEEGRVEQVKARQSPQSLDESMVLTMSLSAAKTWRFTPALKDGRPVKYRQVLPVSLR